MRLHFPSVAIGVVAVSMILVSMSLATTTPAGPPRIEYGPNPRDMVQIREGAPYVVPAGKLFVLTGLGLADFAGTAELRVDGQTEVFAGLGGVGGPSSGPISISSVATVPIGFSAGAGTILEPTDGASGSARGRAWGYLANP